MCAVSSPTRIGDYLVLKTLGKGSTGKVKLGRHVHTGQQVALKIIPISLASREPTLYKKVRREIAVLKLIAQYCRQLTGFSPTSFSIGVMQLIDVYECPNAVVLVLEYCPGGELFDMLMDVGFFPEHLVLDYFQQLVFALEFCHRRGICHRDLKLENILLTRDGRLKLADFGMSTMLPPGSLLYTSCGSPQYCAPEVLRGETYDGKAADMWSLGVILFAITTGGLPFNDDNFQRNLTQMKTANFYIPDQVPSGIASIIRSLLVVDPNQRATIDHIKTSPWFSSRPPRADVFREYCDDDLQNESTSFPSVDDVDTNTLRHLADLGMGDLSILRRRVTSDRHYKERHLYHLLHGFSQYPRPITDDAGDSNACIPSPTVC